MDMPVDLPSSWISQIDLSAISGKVADFTPVIKVIKDTWNKQTLEGLREGKVAVSDELLNESLARSIENNENISDLQVTSIGDKKIKIKANTAHLGRVEMTCRIDRFEHNKDNSTVQFTVVKKKLPDKGFLSFFVSQFSLSMMENFVGKMDLGEEIPMQIKGNTVTLDLKNVLAGSDFGKSELYGYKLIDTIEIQEAVPRDGYIEFKTSLNMPESVENAIKNILK